MRNLRLIALCALIAGATLLGTASAAYAAPSPIYADEFDGGLDMASWATLTPWNTEYTLGELGYYKPSQVNVSGGKLHLVSEEKPSGGRDYTSGIVTSLARQKFSYGYFEIRAKLPKGAGIWPAFWLTNDKSLEIDVLELLGHRPDREYMTLHRNGKQVFQRTYTGPDFSVGYHTYGVDWQPTHVKWFVDGVCRATYAHDVPDDPLWICLNTAVGGEWPGPPNASTRFPQSYDIDYVRVYETMPASAKKAVAKKHAAAKPKPKPTPAAEPQPEADATPAEPPATQAPSDVPTTPADASSSAATLTVVATETPVATDTAAAVAVPADALTLEAARPVAALVSRAEEPTSSVETLLLVSVRDRERPLLSPGALLYALGLSVTPRG